MARLAANLTRDPRAAVAIFDATSPYESVQVQGTASIEDDPDGVLVDELSHKYTGGPLSRLRRPEPAMGDRPDHRRQGDRQLAQRVSGACGVFRRRGADGGGVA